MEILSRFPTDSITEFEPLDVAVEDLEQPYVNLSEMMNLSRYQQRI